MYDVAIIGAGTMGMAAGFYLSREGQKVALIDKHDPPHTNGAHHGKSRLVRRTHLDGDTYTPLATRAHVLFKELQVLSKENLYINDGMLCFGPKDNKYVHALTKTAEELNIPHEFLTAAEINERWPGFKLDDDYEGFLEIDTGIVMPEKVVSTYKRLASEHGADFYMNRTVQSINDEGEHIVIDLGSEIIKSKKVIITGGKMVNDILKHIDYELPITVLRKTFSWFHGDSELYEPDIFPSWTCAFDDGRIFYGFPNLDNDGIKVGRHDGGKEINPNEPIEPFGYFDDDASLGVTQFVREHFSQGSLNAESGDVCTYALSPDQDFIIDRLPNSERMVIACGFSGHAFKFSPAIAEALMLMVTERESDIEVDMRKFRLQRLDTE